MILSRRPPSKLWPHTTKPTVSFPGSLRGETVSCQAENADLFLMC